MVVKHRLKWGGCVTNPYIGKDIAEVSHTHKIKAPLLCRSAKNNLLHQPDWNTPDHTHTFYQSKNRFLANCNCLFVLLEREIKEVKRVG